MQRELRQALEERERLRAQLQKLTVIEQAQAPSGDHVALYAQYNSRLNAVEARLGAIRADLKSHVDTLERSVRAHDDRIRKLNAEAGTLPPEQYQLEYSKAAAERQEAYESMVAVRRMLSAKTPLDLDAPLPAHAGPQNLRRHGDLIPRIALSVVGALILFAVVAGVFYAYRARTAPQEHEEVVSAPRPVAEVTHKPDPAAQQDAREQVAALAGLARTAQPAEMRRAVKDARSAVDRMQDLSEAHRLRTRIDTYIAAAKARLAAPKLEQARKRYERRDFDKATEHCNEILQIYNSPPRLESGSAANLPELAEANTILFWIRCAQDPALRYEVRIFGADTAKVFDRMTGEQQTLKVGDMLDGFLVEDIRFDEAVVLRRGRQTFTLTRGRE